MRRNVKSGTKQRITIILFSLNQYLAFRSALDKATQMAQDKKDKERQDLEVRFT